MKNLPGNPISKLSDSQIHKLADIRNKLDSILSLALRCDREQTEFKLESFDEVNVDLDKLACDLFSVTPLLPTESYQLIAEICSIETGRREFRILEDVKTSENDVFSPYYRAEERARELSENLFTKVGILNPERKRKLIFRK